MTELENIIPITGKVKYPITLDPSVWIFDDRKVDLDTYFSEKHTTSDLEDETKKLSFYWDREIQEGTTAPPIKKSVIKYEKEKILKGSFAMPLRSFIANTEPQKDATTVTLDLGDSNSIDISLDQAFDGFLGFSFKGKPFKEDGPAHFYFGDGSNKENPIRSISKLIIK